MIYYLFLVNIMERLIILILLKLMMVMGKEMLIFIFLMMVIFLHTSHRLNKDGISIFKVYKDNGNVEKNCISRYCYSS